MTQKQCDRRTFGRFPEVLRSFYLIIRLSQQKEVLAKWLISLQAINDAAARTSKENHGKYDHLPKEKNIYGAKLVCADCGARIKLVRSFSTKKDKVYFTFKCPTHAEHGDRGCNAKRKSKAEMDEAVFHAIRTQMNVFMDSASIIKMLLAQKKAINSGAERQRQKRSLNLKIKNLNSSIATLYVDMKDGLLTDEEYLIQKEKYQAQIAELERQLAKYSQDESDTEEQLVGSKRWAAITEEYANATELTEGMLTACVELIKFHADGSLEITFNYMEEFKELLTTTERLQREVA